MVTRSQRIKVAHVTTVDMSLRYLLLNQLSSLAAAGYEVVGISSPGPDVATIEAAGIRHIPVTMTRSPFTPLRDLRALLQLVRIFRRERFTIVHTHTPKPGLLGQVAARLAGVPVVVNTLHGFYFHERTRPALRRFYVLVETLAARCSDIILSQNSEDIGTAVREGICEPEVMELLGNGIDLGKFDPARLRPRTDSEMRRELGIDGNARVVGFVGRLVREKGVVELLRAARRVRQRWPDVRFLLIGPVDAQKVDAVDAEVARELGVADACSFLGHRADMPELYSIMDVLVLPSHREGFPRAPMEASAMGVPCVVTDIRGCRQVVEHERNGLRVPPGDIEALVAAIVKILDDPDAARRLGEEGRKMALEQFDETLVFENVKAAYRRILREKGFCAPAADGRTHNTASGRGRIASAPLAGRSSAASSR